MYAFVCGGVRTPPSRHVRSPKSQQTLRTNEGQARGGKRTITTTRERQEKKKNKKKKKKKNKNKKKKKNNKNKKKGEDGAVVVDGERLRHGIASVEDSGFLVQTNMDWWRDDAVAITGNAEDHDWQVGWFVRSLVGCVRACLLVCAAGLTKGFLPVASFPDLHRRRVVWRRRLLACLGLSRQTACVMPFVPVLCLPAGSTRQPQDICDSRWRRFFARRVLRHCQQEHERERQQASQADTDASVDAAAAVADPSGADTPGDDAAADVVCELGPTVTPEDLWHLMSIAPTLAHDTVCVRVCVCVATRVLEYSSTRPLRLLFVAGNVVAV